MGGVDYFLEQSGILKYVKSEQILKSVREAGSFSYGKDVEAARGEHFPLVRRLDQQVYFGEIDPVSNKLQGHGVLLTTQGDLVQATFDRN